jgi:hypothetical protein
MAPKPTRRDLLKTTATLAATSALAFDRATVDQNKNILLWLETRYRFIKRQSQADPNVWVSLSNQQPAIATATSAEIGGFPALLSLLAQPHDAALVGRRW